MIAVLGQMLFFLCMSAAEDLPDTRGNRLVAAERYLQAAPPKDIIYSVIVEAAKNLPEDIRMAYIDLVTKHIRIEVLERAMVASMVQHFTVVELNALSDFYGSPAGRSAIKKFTAYTAEIMPIMQQVMLKAEKEIEDELKKYTDDPLKKEL